MRCVTLGSRRWIWLKRSLPPMRCDWTTPFHLPSLDGISAFTTRGPSMRAIGYQTSLPSADPASLTDIDLPRPEPTGHDLLVRVEAVSVNPVDTKVRMRAQPEPGQWKVLGWDAAGTVEAVGPEVTLFRPGEAVFYAGALGRPGTNAEFHLVDERIGGHKPASLGFAEAAALPPTPPPRSVLRSRGPGRSPRPRRGSRSSSPLISASRCQAPPLPF